MRTKVAMAAEYTQVALEHIEKLLKRAFRVLRPTQDVVRGEICYDLKLGKFVGVRVWTSVHRGQTTGAGVGSDAIRVGLISLKDKGPLEKGKLPIVKRTQNWADSLKDRIEDCIEKYEEKDEFWEQWAETRKHQETPARAAPIAPVQDPGRDEDGEGDEGEGDDDGHGYTDVHTGPPRELDEIASWARCSNGDWGIAVKDPNAKEGDKVRARTQGGDESTITLAKFDRAHFGKRVFYKGKQEGGRPQRNQGYGYDRRRY